MGTPAVVWDGEEKTGQPPPVRPSPQQSHPAVVWDGEGQTGGGHDPALDNAPQGNSGFLGPIQDAYDSAIARPPQADLDKVGPIGRAFANIGRHVLQAASPIMHPNQTGQALFKQFQPGATFKDTPLYQMGSSIVGDYKAHGPVEGTEDLAGDVLGGYLGGKLAEAPLKAGAPMERVGYGAINDALGARGPKPFQYGHNPARGALEEGVVPAMTKQASSARIGPAMDRVGGDIAGRVGSSPNRVLMDDIAQSVDKPLSETSAVMEGPGGGPGRSSAPLDELRAYMTHQAPGATQPIYRSPAPSLSAPFDPTAPVHNAPLLQGTADASASDLWHTIRNLDANTRFNPQPEIEGLNDVRRSIRGGLSGNLKDAVPEVAHPMQTYGDLAGAHDAIERTIHSGQSLSKIMDLIKYPAETYGGAGLVKGGRLLQSIDPRFLRTIGRAPAVAAPLLKQGGQ